MMFWPQFEKFFTFLFKLVRQMLPRHQLTLEAIIQVVQGAFNQWKVHIVPHGFFFFFRGGEN